MSQVRPRDQRTSIRFNKIFKVTVSTEEFAEIDAVARNISAGGMLIETVSPSPLGSEIRVRFDIPDSQASIVARAEVKNHYVFNYNEDGRPRWARGMGVRFLEFVEDGEEMLRLSLTKCRTLH
jgi:c-di-GMP-binding flagellar brake protein YcgR